MSCSLFSYIYADEARCVDALLDALSWDEARANKIQTEAKKLVQSIRAEKLAGGQLESFMQQYSLATDEGLALMCLAEALLRIPDKATINDLIKDKIGATNWMVGSSDDWVVKAAGVGLLMTSKTLDSALSRVGRPFIREAMMKAMRILGRQFVLGCDIEDAFKNADIYKDKGYRMSYDMLGEGARNAADADKYFESYMAAIKYIGESSAANVARPPGISLKLSALHPRYEYAQREQCIPPMIERVRELASLAASHGLALTIDAEEVERLGLSLEIIEGVLQDKSLSGWEGFGLAVQAYQKCAYPLLDQLVDMSRQYKHRLQIRLVKGAYWDSEIKRAQMLGLSDYSVFTRKANTDLSFLTCAAKLFEHQDYFYPMLATHNAHSATSVIEMAKISGASYEFQRLHGMGEALFNILLRDEAVFASVYAPVGAHKELLPYLVRRLLENGANTSFVNRLLDPDEPVEKIIADPVADARKSAEKRHSKIVMPRDIYAHEQPQGRRNSQGLDLNDDKNVQNLLEDIGNFNLPAPPANTTRSNIEKTFQIAQEAFDNWSHSDVVIRAEAIENYADMLEENRAEIMALCINEAGKTIPDALAEIREAVDFCRYYANRGRVDFCLQGQIMPGPTGESNVLSLHGRGVFICISPWNFPLAIFTGQVVAALMAGNTVIAKPAEQTPLIAIKAVELMHRAGIPAAVINLVIGDGYTGATLVRHPEVSGVAFTGSTEVAREINKTLADKKGPIVPLIAETGGQNVMIVDSSALPEQVVDDVIVSAFGSAGQRCSALRVLCIQDEIADKVLNMLKGAMKELRIGNPADLSSDIGPVIDEEALANLKHHRENLKGFGRLLCEMPMDQDLNNQGHYFAPCAFEVNGFKGLEHEVFGPILHIIRYKKSELDDLMQEINDTGYGLTFGVHSRIKTFQDRITGKIRAGNAYVNRSMIGAVVGTQPFGGHGLSGTGPKAGGPHYLQRFATEKVITVDTTAAGGNASLVSLEE